MDRSTRNLSIITLVVLAIFLALNHIARRSGLADWGLVLFFVLLALAIWFYDRVSSRSVDDAEMADTIIEPLTYEHQVGTISIPESIQVAGPDLTRSPSPVQEVPSVPQSQPEKPSEPATGTQTAANQPSDTVEPYKSETLSPASNTDDHSSVSPAAPTTIEEKSAPPSSAAAPETHPDLADKTPDGTWSPSAPPPEGSSNEPVPTPVSGTAPEPSAPRTNTEPIPDISSKEASQGVSATSDVKVSASDVAHAQPASPDPNLPINAVTNKPDDLKIIEGIGPKMEKALQAAGISTFAMLAGASETQIRQAITAAGMRFAPTVPTWAEQASYAANGDFVGLEAFQKTLISGRKDK